MISGNFRYTHKIVYGLCILLVMCAIAYGMLVFAFRPSHDRSWELGHGQLPHITQNEGTIYTIENFRNFDWISTSTAHVRYETREVDLATLETVDIIISHFDDFEGLAHIYLSFGFREGGYVIVSLETRREDTEDFSPLLGILRQYEIIYVVGSEEDITGLRTDLRDERVYLYSTNIPTKQAQALFLAITKDINGVYVAPRMYNTLTRNCTNEITRRIEEVSDISFPSYSWKITLPGYFDEVLYDLKLIAHNKPFEIIKMQHLVDNDSVDRHKETYSEDLRHSVDYTKQ